MENVERHIKIEKEKARALRKSVWWQRKIAQDATCYYCSAKMLSDNVTMDHIVPLSRGGKSQPSNVVTCCKDCNNRKRDLTAFEFVQDSHPVPS